MRFNIPHKRRLLCTAVSLSLLPLSNASFAQAPAQAEPEVEEVVVTGSYIRRSEGFTQASQITQLNADDLADQGTMNLGEVIQNMSFVGGPSSSVTNTIQGTSSGSQSIDLRGLGPRSTLTLLDGKRIASENVQSMVPTIAIQRIDIVADGAAALYGNEAVAGVVNFVPYTSYDGVKMEVYGERDGEGDYDEESAQMMWGGDIGGLDVVLAGQYKTNSRLAWDERPYLAQAGMNYSSLAPGNYTVPLRDAAGQYTGKTGPQADPNCAPASQRQFWKAGESNNPFGMKVGNNCWVDYGDTRSYREPMDIGSVFANATWELSDDLTLRAQYFTSRLYQMSYTSTSNPGNSRIGELPSIRGEQPGNPFLAKNSAGLQLYGIDANRDGLPDRGTQDINKDGLMDYLVSGTTANGVLLREDVRARSLRPINKTHTMSDGHTSDGDNMSGSTNHNSRALLQADFKVPFLEGWEGMAAYAKSEQTSRSMSNQNYDIEAMKQGLKCDVRRDRDACYNPFFVMDQSTNNTKDMMNAVAARDREMSQDWLDTVDIVLNGEIPLGGFELPGGVIGAAVGYQWRNDKYTNTPSASELRGDTWIGSPFPEEITTGTRDVDAYFVELAIPVLETVEIEAAVRHESFSTDQKSTDPKFGITWATTEWLTLRATTGDAFIAPSLTQLLNPVSCGLSTVSDRFTPFSAFTTACAGGNPALENEYSTSKQLGMDLAFGDFDFSLTWNETDFQNRIVGISGQTVMNNEFAAFKAWSGFAGSGVGAANQPTRAQLAAWLASGKGNPDILRDPDDLGSLLQITTPGSVNATSVKVTAYDIQSNYRFDMGDMGAFRINLQATVMDSFEYQDNATAAVKEGLGQTNLLTATAPAVPEIKANLRLGWTLANHAVTGTVHYVSALDWDGTNYIPSILQFAGTNPNPSIVGGQIKAWTDFDLAYTYRGISLYGGEMGVSVGSRNIFDRQAQRTPDFAGVIGELQDPMGRSLYARLTYDF
ncbi:MAG: TonB-dependent receptor [Gammaproteobacteria bacterium]|nr:TonB-dependent receptor [Gammaproteobacteria bacterium]